MSITPASKWGVGTKEETFPSGNVAKVKERVNFFALVRTGIIKDDLLDTFNALQSGEDTDIDYSNFVAFASLVAEQMFVEPKVTSDASAADDSTLYVGDISDADLMHVIALASGGEATASFPEQPGSNGSSADGEVLEGDAKPDTKRKPRRVSDKSDSGDKTG